MRRVFILLCALNVLICLITGCNIKPETEFKQTGTTCANAVMGLGYFAHANDFLYVSGDRGIYEYDMQSGKTLLLPIDETWFWNLFVTQNYIYWVDSSKGIQYMTKDGKQQSVYYTPPGLKCWYLFADEHEFFYLEGRDGDLIHQSLPLNTGGAGTTGSDSLISHVNQYYVDESYIYAVILANEDEGAPENYLARSSRESISFEKVELSFPPIAVVASGEDLFLSTQGTFQLVRQNEGKEIPLPINAVYYQVLDGHIIYADSNTYNNGQFTIKSYDLETEKITELAEDIWDFSILENRYICMKRGASNSTFLYYDWQEKELVNMFTEE